MHPRHPLPRTWLMTDERLGDALWDALERLPRGSGVIFRDYATPPAQRRARFARVLAVARRRRLVLIRAGKVPMRGEMGVHNARLRRPGIRTRSVHNASEARTKGVDAVLVSPIFATRSHPGARTLGPIRFGLLKRAIAVPVIALGGMDQRQSRRLARFGIHGWAAITAWTR